MIWREIKQYWRQYLLLVLGIAIFSTLFMAVWPNREWQRVIALLFGGFYFVWGSLTHLHAKHLTQRLVWEYLSVGLLVSSLLLMMTW